MSEFRNELISSIKKFRLDRMEPLMEADDAEGKFRMEIYHELGQMGLTGVTIPEEYGGAGLPYSDFCAILEEIAKSSVPYAVTISVSTMVQGMLKNFGSAEQKQKYLPPLTA